LNASIVDFDWAFQFHPKLLPTYLEPAVIFYRLRKFDGVFPGIAPAKASRLKSAPAIARIPRLDRAPVAPSVTPLRHGERPRRMIHREEKRLRRCAEA
jgi:hypothetical protein